MTQKPIDLTAIDTEKQNINTAHIDELSTLEMVRLINREDQAVINAVEQSTIAIARAVDAAFEVISKGGRLIYMGAGTSGRLGVLDAAECLPTFGVGEESIIALIAGGDRALRHPVEAAEDDESAAISDLTNINFNYNDILCAISASGRTHYCLAGLKMAQSTGAKSISLVCTEQSPMAALADFPIEAVVGSEVIAGSTRMKSGSAQKMILNMLSTGVMIKLGKVYGNLMVDLKPTNAKLIERARRMIMSVTHCSYERAQVLLDESHQGVKVAIVMELCDLTFADADALLLANQNRIALALKSYRGA